MGNIAPAICERFLSLEDRRADHLVDHKLINIVIIAVCAVVCGAERGTDAELFCTKALEWLRQFLELEHGIPAHDTFGRVFARLDPAQFAKGSFS